LPVRRRPPPRAAQSAAPRGRSWAGLWLFLLGILVGAAGTYAGCRDVRGRSADGHAGVAGDAAGGESNVGADSAAGDSRRGSRAAAAARGRHGQRPAAGGRDRQSADDSSAAREAPSDAADSTPGQDAGPGASAAPNGASVAAGAGGISSGGGTGANGAAKAGGATGATGTAGASGEGKPGRIALVIDDLGRSLDDLESLRQLGVPVTYAVLPFESQTPEVAAALRRRHEEILCHLPMEPRSGGDPGPGALRIGMSQAQLRQSTLAALAAVPGAVGVNNHMGSSLSADAPSMATILGVLAERRLFFLDSRTSAQSVGYRVATSLGVPAAERQVFLDDDPHPDAVAGQFQRLLDLSRTRGEAIAIGHPHANTLATLAAEVPRARAQGFRFVLVSDLLDRPHPPPAPVTGR
jgi:polysaccharide deacetylase 2 family uncharacterized protein YibQ